MENGFGEIPEIQFGQGNFYDDGDIRRSGRQLWIVAYDFVDLAAKKVSLDGFCKYFRADDDAKAALVLFIGHVPDDEKRISDFPPFFKKVFNAIAR